MLFFVLNTLPMFCYDSANTLSFYSNNLRISGIQIIFFITNKRKVKLRITQKFDVFYNLFSFKKDFESAFRFNSSSFTEISF